MGATLLNTALSLTAIGLWFFSPNTHRQSSVPASSAEIAPLPAPQTRPPRPLVHAVPPLPLPNGQTPPPEQLPAGTFPPPVPPGIFDPGGRARTGNAKISPATKALAERLNLDPQILATTFANEAGDLPTNVTKGLEHAFDSATSLAKRQKLNEYQSQSLVTILTYYEFSVLREEKAAAPGPVDPTRIEALQERNLLDIATTCGEETRKAAEIEIDRW